MTITTTKKWRNGKFRSYFQFLDTLVILLIIIISLFRTEPINFKRVLERKSSLPDTKAHFNDEYVFSSKV